MAAAGESPPLSRVDAGKLVMKIAAVAAIAVVFAFPAVAAPRSLEVATTVGRSNVRVRVILHPQADKCAQSQLQEIRKRAVAIGQDHIRRRLKAIIAKSGTDASGEKEFFGVSVLAGCPADGGAWIVFPVEGKQRSVSRYEPKTGWSPMIPL